MAGQPAIDLIVTLDDATNTIYAAFLRPSGRCGLPLSLYTDRGSHCFHTPDAGGKVDRTRPTQVGRVLTHLGVEHIAAHSPQARGRSERVFHTLQNRVTEELALTGIGTIEAADAYLRNIYIPAHNERFAVEDEQDGSAFVAIAGVDLGEILCVQEEWQVGNDNCVSPATPASCSARSRAGESQRDRSDPGPARSPRRGGPSLASPLLPGQCHGWEKGIALDGPYFTIRPALSVTA